MRQAIVACNVDSAVSSKKKWMRRSQLFQTVRVIKSFLTCCALQIIGSLSCLKNSSMDTKRVFSSSSSTSDSSGEVQRSRRGLVSWGLRRSVVRALGGVGMRSGVPSLALGSSMNSVMEGKGRIVPGLSVSLRSSNTAAAAATAAVTGAGAGAGSGTATVIGDGWGAELVGEVTWTCRWQRHLIHYSNTQYAISASRGKQKTFDRAEDSHCTALEKRIVCRARPSEE